MYRYLIGFIICIWALIPASRAQSGHINWNKSNAWVDSVMNTLDDDHRIAQLMMIAAYNTRETENQQDILCHIKQYGIGGLIFFKGNPTRHAVLTNIYQEASAVPILIAIDGEWGLSMRLDSVPVFPRLMVLGAANDIELTRRYGVQIGKQCERLGIHLNFAPDVDVNNNILNPVINDRSFGENKFIVARHGAAYALGMQQQRVMACAKHFPGHGDTESDSHFNLPVIKCSRERLDSLELYPFQYLVKQNVASVMVAHLNVPALDTNSQLPSSLSPTIVNGLLKKEMGYDGLVITDGLNMKAVSGRYLPGEAAAMALVAGNDLLLLVEDVPQSIAMIKQYIRLGKITKEQINQSCRKILLAKYWSGLSLNKKINTNYLTADLNCCETELFTRQVVRKACIVARNQDNIIPLCYDPNRSLASVAVGATEMTAFQKMFNRYVSAEYYQIDKNETQARFDSLADELLRYNVIVVSLHATSRYVSKKLGLTQAEIDFVNKLAKTRKIILVNHGNPYILQHFRSCRNIVVAFEDLPLYNEVAAQVVCGAIEAGGTMPVSIQPDFALGSGIETAKSGVLERCVPEEAGIDRNNFSAIDSIVTDAIRAKAMPGCQVLVAWKNKVIYEKSFGSQRYDTLIPVQYATLYDLASLTKVLSTTLAIMKLYEDKQIRLTDKLSFYLPFLKNTNKEKITIQDVLLHQSGLPPFIPFYKNYIHEGHFDSTFFSRVRTPVFCVSVADSLYTTTQIEKEIFNRIAQCELNATNAYVYSDLGFMLLRKLVESIKSKPFEVYMQENFYRPLQLATMGFQPLKRFPQSRIAPTENDTLFRHQLVHGYVHDPAAALLGGVSGHAGLFANASDVAVIMQMLLNRGVYDGTVVLKASTVDLFTKRFAKTGSRRGLGFDKPETTPGKASPTGSSCSSSTFGHTGFTGTCTWADQEHQLVYVFLSNRVHPDAENKKLSDLNVRTRIQDAIYEAIKVK